MSMAWLAPVQAIPLSSRLTPLQLPASCRPLDVLKARRQSQPVPDEVHDLVRPLGNTQQVLSWQRLWFVLFWCPVRGLVCNRGSDITWVKAFETHHTDLSSL